MPGHVPYSTSLTVRAARSMGKCPCSMEALEGMGGEMGRGGIGGGLGGFVRGIGRRPVGRMEANSLLDLFVSDITGE